MARQDCFKEKEMKERHRIIILMKIGLCIAIILAFYTLIFGPLTTLPDMDQMSRTIENANTVPALKDASGGIYNRFQHQAESATVFSQIVLISDLLILIIFIINLMFLREKADTTQTNQRE